MGHEEEIIVGLSAPNLMCDNTFMSLG